MRGEERTNWYLVDEECKVQSSNIQGTKEGRKELVLFLIEINIIQILLHGKQTPTKRCEMADWSTWSSESKFPYALK